MTVIRMQFITSWHKKHESGRSVNTRCRSNWGRNHRINVDLASIRWVVSDWNERNKRLRCILSFILTGKTWHKFLWHEFCLVINIIDRENIWLIISFWYYLRAISFLHVNFDNVRARTKNDCGQRSSFRKIKLALRFLETDSYHPREKGWLRWLLAGASIIPLRSDKSRPKQKMNKAPCEVS